MLPPPVLLVLRSPNNSVPILDKFAEDTSGLEYSTLESWGPCDLEISSVHIRRSILCLRNRLSRAAPREPDYCHPRLLLNFNDEYNYMYINVYDMTCFPAMLLPVRISSEGVGIQSTCVNSAPLNHATARSRSPWISRFPPTRASRSKLAPR